MIIWCYKGEPGARLWIETNYDTSITLDNLKQIFLKEDLGDINDVFFPIIEIPQHTTLGNQKVTVQVFNEYSKGFELLEIEAVVSNNVAEFDEAILVK